MHIKETVTTLVLASRLSALEVLHNSCNIGTCDLPDMYACSPRAHITTIKINKRCFNKIYAPVPVHIYLVNS